MEPIKVKRGDVFWCNFDPTLGREVKKRRPAIIVSNDDFNDMVDLAQVIPITSKVKKIYPGEDIFILDGIPAKFMPGQIRTVSKKRLGRKIGELSMDVIRKLNDGIILQLGL